MPNILPTILIIENDAITLDLYRRELSQDFDVITCAGKNELFETIYSQDLDAIVLEPIALDGQGWDLFNSILALPASVRSFPVVLCSVLDERKRGMEMGAAVFLVKPVLPLQLMETLYRVIGATEIVK